MERQHVRSCFYCVFAFTNLEALLEVGTSLLQLCSNLHAAITCDTRPFLSMTFATFSVWVPCFVLELSLQS